MKEFFERIWEILKRLILLPIIIALIAVLAYFGYFAYIDSNAHAAKLHIMDKYGFTEKELKTTEYVKYVNQDISDCGNLWFKECTDIENLAFKYVFETKDGKVIIVLETKDGDYSDDYSDEENPKEKGIA